LVVVAALLAALLAAPALIDWNLYRNDLSARIEAVLGRHVSIDGEMSFSLLPAPTLSARDVRLANIEGAGTPDMARVQSLEVRLRLLPLLTGRRDFSSLVLVSPDIHLERLADGRANWQFKGMPAPLPGPPPSAEASAAEPLPAAAPSIGSPRIEAVTVENGTVDYRIPGAEPRRIDLTEANFSTRPDSVRAYGAARFEGIEFSFDAQEAVLPRDQPAPVSLVVRFGHGAGEVRVGGQMTGQSEHRTFKGKLSAKADDMARFARALGLNRAAGVLPGGSFGLDAILVASPHEFVADGINMTFAGLQANGGASLALDDTPQLDLKLAFSRLDLDSWLARAAKSPPAPVKAPTAGESPGPGPAIADSTVGFTFPKGFAATVDLAAEVVNFRGGILRRAKLNAALANGEITVNQASLGLPGDSELNVFGFLAAAGGSPSFDGSFEGSSDDVRDLLEWLKVDVAAVPPDRLHAARLAGNVAVKPGEVSIGGTQLRLDGTRIDVAATLRLGERLALGASFAVDTLNADAYWPRRKSALADPIPSPSAPQPVAAAGSATTASWLDAVDANVKGHIGQLVVRGMTAQDVAIDASWLNGLLTLHELSVADLVGAQLKLDGGIDGLSSGQPSVHALHYELRSKQPGRLLRQQAIALPFDPDRLGAVALSGTLDGGPETLNFDTRTEAAGALLAIAGKVNSVFVAPKVDLGIEASHSSVAQLVRLFAADYRPAASLGSFAASAKVQGDSTLLQFSDLRIKAGPVTAAGDARLGLGGKPRVDASLSAGEIPLDGFLPGRRQADLHPSFRDMIESGLLVPAKSQFSAHGEPRPGLQPIAAAPRAAVAVGGIPDRWSRQPIDLSWQTGFDGGLKLDARALTYGRTRLESLNLGISLADGVITIERLGAQLYGGKLSASGRLSADGALALQLALDRAQMREALLGVGDVDVAEGVMDADAALTTSGHSVAEMAGRLNGSGKFAVRNGVVRGFDLKAADDRLHGVDSPTSLLAVLQAGLTGGKTDFSSLTGSFHAANGLISSNDVKLVADGGDATGSAQINLPVYVVDARAEFHLASAPSGPPLVMRLAGPLDGPRRFMDINEIQTWLIQRVKTLKGKLTDHLLHELGR
jgi:uncharacterized protein involved in outer membrane biogenesis